MRKKITPSWLARAAGWGFYEVLEYIDRIGVTTGENIRQDVGCMLTPLRRKALIERGIIATGSRRLYKDIIYLGLHGRRIMEGRKRGES